MVNLSGSGDYTRVSKLFKGGIEMKMIRGNRLGKIRFLALFFLLVFLYGLSLSADSAKKALTFQDIMKFKEIHDAIISEHGRWVVYHAQPDRGNGEVLVHDVDNKRSFTIKRGEKPIITKDGKWVAAAVQPDALALEKAKDKEKLKPGMAILETATGKATNFERVKEFAFSDDSKWLVYHLYPDEEKTQEKNDKNGTQEKGKKEKEDKWAKKTAPLVLRYLPTSKEIRIDQVLYFALDPASHFTVYSIYQGGGKHSGLYARSLASHEAPARAIHEEPDAIYSNLTWSKKRSRLVYLSYKEKGKEKKKKKDPDKKSKYLPGIWLWEGLKARLKPAVLKQDIPEGWMIPAENKITWTEDEERFYFGFKPMFEYKFYQEEKKKEKKQEEKLEEKDLYDINRLLEKRGVDVWHWQDPLINPQQKKMWDSLKKRIYLAVYHIKKGYFVQLSDKDMPYIDTADNPGFVLGSSDVPYLRETTWDGRYKDFYLVDINRGSRNRLLTHHEHDVSLSPGGKFVAFYQDKHWHLYDIGTTKTMNLTASISTPFYDEDHDYPSDVPPYGIAGWAEKDKAVLIYDKYDIWQFFTGSGKSLNITGQEGREKKIEFRINRLDPEQEFFKPGQELLLSAYSHEDKYTHFYSAVLGRTGIKQLVEGPKKFSFQKKAKQSDRIIYTRQSFEEFPDIWISDGNFKSPTKISQVNPQIKEFLWGKARLIEWYSLDGIRLQGVVITPENFDSSKRYPVLVYFYRFSSQRLHEFNQMVVNHRPNFPFYVSNGYVMFLPDVRFQVGRPGFSATKCIVPGVQELIDMGIADPRAIALHGHSWSGYQTAFVITQTDIFAAAIAGAVVANMTSAYSGIRWGSGMARQFQYEKSQSRIGKSLWEAPQLYIENSPAFFAERINTPLLIEHGDQDEAVPWSQAIELYLAMRRLNKTCIFLQYNDEPHHLKKYPNKLDYSIKMKEFLDYYLKGTPAPDWIKNGVPYQKK